MTLASIVVPTRNNAELVADCVRSILADSSSVPRELIVVDNASTDDTRAVVAGLAEGAPFPVQLLYEPARGSSHARNAGVAAATGELVLFADDDVVVEDGWADALVHGLDDPAIGLVGGRILPAWPAQPPPWLANGSHQGVLALMDFGPEDRLLEAHEMPYTANAAVRMSILRSLPHPFAPDLGHDGKRHYGWEDYHLVRRVRERHAIGYAAGAVVHHRIDARRMTLDWLRGAFFDIGIGQYRADLHEGLERPDLARRLVRAARVSRQVLRLRRANDRGERQGPETRDELAAYLWAGRHAEMLLGARPRLRDLLRRAVV